MPHHTKKVEINLGYACNAKCPFCYYYDSVVTKTNENTLTTEQAKQQLRLARKLGIKEIEFTGGEVTLRQDLLELITYAKQDCGFAIVCLITNGIRLAKRPYIDALAAAGVDDILFSVHGHNASIHDALTKVPHSFDHILTAIDHARELGIRVRTNTVVCKTNYLYLTDIMHLLIDKQVDNINLVMFNPVIQAKNVDIVKEVYVDYADAGKEIIKAIQKHEPRLPHFNVRYMPFCFLPGYEQYVTNLDQMTFDPDEWDNYASIRIRKGWILANLCALLGLLNTAYIATVIRYGIKAMLTTGMSRFYILKDRTKTTQCKNCAYEHVCDYIYEHYYKIYGDKRIVPVAGEKIRDPAWKMVAARIRKPGELLPRRTYSPISEQLKRELVS